MHRPDLPPHLTRAVEVRHDGQWRSGTLESYHVRDGIAAAYVSFTAHDGKQHTEWFDMSNVRPDVQAAG